MKVKSVLFALLLCASGGLAQSPAKQSFDALKGLAGEWGGKDTLGHDVQITFRATSGGSALLSELIETNPAEPNQREDMITMFHLDGDRLLLTHYCSAGNQPRMKGRVSPDGKTITFDFVSVTNLSSPRAGHMLQLVIKILGANQHTEEWTLVENGKESKDLIDLRRIRKP